MKPLLFTFIGDYLGADKTTLFNHPLAKAKDLRVAVLVNDLGGMMMRAGASVACH